MAITYCNTTSDLTNAYREIDRYKGYFTLDSTKWAVHASNVYIQKETGQVNALFEDGVPLTKMASLALIVAAAQWFYDSTNDYLYVWCTANADPDTKTMESGESWAAFKATCRNDAQEMLEGFLRNVFVTPFRKIIAPDESYNSASYDFWIVRATALLTCYLMVKRLNLDDKLAEYLYREVYNTEPEPGEKRGIVQYILDGAISLKIQRSNREPGGFNVYDYASNTATAFVEITGSYLGSQKQIWRLQIDTSGAVGTATWKLSKDQGTTWDTTLQKTRKSDSDQRRFTLGSGIDAEFVGTFVSGDYWDIELFPISDIPDRSQFSSVTMVR
jgi:hypothetical protein